MLDDELEELSSIQKDLRFLQYIAQMTMVYPAWGGDSDTLRVIACAVGQIAEKLIMYPRKSAVNLKEPLVLNRGNMSRVY